jgi:hypothetical protein
MTRIPLLASLVLCAPAWAETNQATVTFSAGAEGWSLLGYSTVTATGGNPAHRIFWNNIVDNFGMSARTSTHPAFVGNYTQKGPVTLAIDWQVNFIQFFGQPVSRDLVVILYDDDSYNGAPPASVWKHVGTLTNSMPWTTFSATVENVMSPNLPAGWEGAGDEDPNTFEPILPAGRTWTNVLQGVDRVEFTTLVPGYFYGFTNFSLSIDNVRITPIAPPCPEDLTDDGLIDGADLGTLLGEWGLTSSPADFNNDGKVDGADLGQLLGSWGPC